MKLQNMKLARKWREYAGPKDERLEAENAKIYKLGFMLLSFGMLTLLVYQIMAQQVAWVHDGADEAFRLFANPVDAVMYAWLFIVMIICAVMQTRKGYVDTNRFGQTEHIPMGYFLLISGITGTVSALAIAAMRCIAEAQIVPIESVFWGANLATGVVFGVTIFVAVFGALCLAFFEAKQRRAKIEAELDCPDDLQPKRAESAPYAIPVMYSALDAMHHAGVGFASMPSRQAKRAALKQSFGARLNHFGNAVANETASLQSTTRDDPSAKSRRSNRRVQRSSCKGPWSGGSRFGNPPRRSKCPL